MPYTAIDLFSGCGGMRLGFEQAGIECVWSCDIDKFACKTYEHNFNETPICADIKDVPSSAIPEHDILFAGFPCNSFAKLGVAARAKTGQDSGLQCKRYGGLIWDVLRIAVEKRPHALFLENVKNLIFHDKGNTMLVIMDEFARNGYPLSWRLVNSYPYVPQNRWRVFLIGVDSARYPNFYMHFPKKPVGNPTLADVLDKDQALIPDKSYLTPRMWAYLQKETVKKYKTWGGFRHTICSPGDVTKTLCARYYTDGREILIDAGRSTPRKITVKEASRLMGFPEWFEFPVSYCQTFRQLGNSVVPPLITDMSLGLVKSLDRLPLTLRT